MCLKLLQRQFQNNFKEAKKKLLFCKIRDILRYNFIKIQCSNSYLNVFLPFDSYFKHLQAYARWACAVFCPLIAFTNFAVAILYF